MSNFAFGAGYKLNNKYSLEIKYQTNRNILRENPYWTGKYQSTSVILGYTLF